MKKSALSIDRIKNKRSMVTYEQMRVSKVAAIEVRDERYRFKNKRKSMILYFDSFDTFDRSGYGTSKTSSKLVGDMVCYYGVDNIVGYSTYYPKDGDIFCEFGCVYTKNMNILLITLLDLRKSNMIAVINKSQIDHELVKYILDCYKKNTWVFDCLVIGNPFDYIRQVNKWQ